MNAESIARHYAALLPGGIEGVELLSARCVEMATEWQDWPNLQGTPVACGLGYMPIDLQGLRGFGHDGYGGSFGAAWPQLQLAVAFTHNLLNSGTFFEPIFSEILQFIKPNLTSL